VFLIEFTSLYATAKFTPHRESLPSTHSGVGHISFLSFVEGKWKTKDPEPNAIKHAWTLIRCQHVKAYNFDTLRFFSNVLNLVTFSKYLLNVHVTISGMHKNINTRK